jgi:hypothetical protein
MTSHVDEFDARATRQMTITTTLADVAGGTDVLLVQEGIPMAY